MAWLERHLTGLPWSACPLLICHCLAAPCGQGALGALGSGVSFPLCFEVSKRHLGNAKGVLIINHGNSGIQMSGVVLASEYLVVCWSKLTSPLSPLSSGPGHHCHISPFISVLNRFPYASKCGNRVVCFIVCSFYIYESQFSYRWSLYWVKIIVRFIVLFGHIILPYVGRIQCLYTFM